MPRTVRTALSAALLAPLLITSAASSATAAPAARALQVRPTLVSASPHTFAALEDDTTPGRRVRAEGDSVVAGGPQGERVGLQLPHARARSADQDASGAIDAYANPDGTTTTVVSTQGDAIQILQSVPSASGPTRFEYQLSLSGPVKPSIMEDGTVVFLNDRDELVAGIAKPWAKDAKGRAVPTHFELRGNVLVQVVDHRGVPDITYPVVADPYLGYRLYHWATAGYTEKYWTKVNAKVTPWGKLNNGTFFFSYHVDEVKSLLPKGWRYTLDWSTMRNQLYCHIFFGVLEYSGEYNLESRRETWNWLAQASVACNPPLR